MLGRRMLEVVTLVDQVAAGGAERAALELTTHFGPGARATLVASRLAPDAASDPRYAPSVAELSAAGVAFAGAGRTSKARLWEWRPVVALLRRRRADVLHTHGWGSNAWGPLLARLAGVPVVVAHEQTPFARSGGLRVWRSQLLVNRCVTGPFAEAILVPSAWSRRALIEYERVDPAKIRVVPNGARAAAPVDRAAVRRELGAGPEDRLVVVAAMLRPEKAHDVLLRAVSRLPDPARVRLLVAGAGPVQDPAGSRPELERLAGELGIADRVRFLGRREDVPRLVAACDVAVLPSAHENFPLAVLEYMAAGTPIVATAVGGVPEMIEDGVHGLLVPPGDPARLAEAIADTLERPAAAAERAARAAERRRSTYDWGVIARTVLDLYRELLSARRGP